MNKERDTTFLYSRECSILLINKLWQATFEKGLRTWRARIVLRECDQRRSLSLAHARTEIERVYVFFYRGPGAKHFSTERPSLRVCAFVRGSAPTVVQFPTPTPPSAKKARKFTGRWHEKMGRKGLNCDAANATLHEQADWKRSHPYPPLVSILVYPWWPP